MSSALIESLAHRIEQRLIREEYMGFNKLKGELAGKGASNPGALAAYIGRKKYGAGKFNKAASKGKKLGKKSAEMEGGPGSGPQKGGGKKKATSVDKSLSKSTYKKPATPGSGRPGSGDASYQKVGGKWQRVVK